MDLEDTGIRVKFVLHDRDASFTATFDAVFQVAGVRVIRSAVQAPRMNSIMERLIGSCRREMLDRTLVWNQRHLMTVLREYEDFYNSHRPPRTLTHAAPLRPLPGGVTDLDQFRVRRRDRAGGVIHEYRLVAYVIGTHKLRCSRMNLLVIWSLSSYPSPILCPPRRQLAACGLSPAASRRSVGRGAGVQRDVRAERIVVGLVDQVGFPGPLVAQAGQHRGQPLAKVSEVGWLVAGLVQLVAQRGDGVLQLTVVQAQAADPVAQPGLAAGDVGQQAVGQFGVTRLVGGRLGEYVQRGADAGAPCLLPARGSRG
jgi:Integrase core domain